MLVLGYIGLVSLIKWPLRLIDDQFNLDMIIYSKTVLFFKGRKHSNLLSLQFTVSIWFEPVTYFPINSILQVGQDGSPTITHE